MAALLCASLLFGMAGCTKPAETPEEPEPIDGGTTIKTDPDAPKVIESKDIRAFSANFFLVNRWRGEMEDWNRFFEFRIENDENGTLMATETHSGASLPADKDLLNALQIVIDGYDLASRNGVYEVTAGLPPEYQESTLQVSYESGEYLTFTVNNEPEAKWAEAVFDVFAEWFAANGDDSLESARESSLVTRFDIDSVEDAVYLRYGGIKVAEDEAIDGENYLLEWSVYDDAAQTQIEEEFIRFPEDYYERITEILAKYDVVLKYDRSYYDHSDGYYGMSGKGPDDGEADLENRRLDIYIEFESGKSMSIETSKESELEALKPMLDEIFEYHASLF